METKHSCNASTNHWKVCAGEDCQVGPSQSVESGASVHEQLEHESARIAPSGKTMKNLRLLAALANAIKSRRQARHITQDELAHATGLDRSYIVSIEKGKRNISITKVVQIAGKLGLSAAQLLKLTEDQLGE